MRKKIAVITGSSRGIGRATAEVFGKLGYSVVMNNKTHSLELTSAVESLSRRGADVFELQFDVADYDRTRASFDKVVEKFGRIDVLVNNAGIVADRTLENMDTQTWDSVMRTNLYGPFHCMRCVIPIMKDQKGGAIVNVSSVVGLRGNFGQGNYASSKAGLIGLTLVAAKELARYGIRVNAVAPGFVETRMLRSVPPEYLRKIVENIPMGRIGKTCEIAEAIAFLATATYITGHVLVVDGGYLL